MAAKKPLVMGSNGYPEQLQSGDTLNAQVSEVDVKTGTAAEAIAEGDVVYINSSGEVALAQANAGATSVAIGIALAAAAGAATVTYQTNGDAAGVFTGLTAGTNYFLSPTTPGATTSTVPTTAGQYVVPIGIATATTDMQIRIAYPTKL